MGGLPLLAISLAFLALAFGYRDYARGRPPFLTAALLAATAAGHVYLALWAGLGLTYFLHGSRRPALTLHWLARAAAIALGLGSVALLPWLVAMLGPIRKVPLRFGPTPLVEPRTWPLVVSAVLVIALLAIVARARGGLDRRVLYAGHAGLVGLILPGLVPVVPEDPPLAFAARGAAGACGLVLSALTLAGVGYVVLRGKRPGRSAEPLMPRALTPAVLEMCPPPPPPRRWGSVVPLALLAALIATRILLGAGG